MLKERETQVTEEYDKVLREKLAGDCDFGQPGGKTQLSCQHDFPAEKQYKIVKIAMAFS